MTNGVVYEGFLGSDVLITSAGVWFEGPSVTVPHGTWLVTAVFHVDRIDNLINGQWHCEIYDAAGGKYGLQTYTMDSFFINIEAPHTMSSMAYITVPESEGTRLISSKIRFDNITGAPWPGSAFFDGECPFLTSWCINFLTPPPQCPPDILIYPNIPPWASYSTRISAWKPSGIIAGGTVTVIGAN